MTLVEASQALRARAAQFAGKWHAAGREVFDDQRERIALARDTSTAVYLADIHNHFLPVLNSWLLAQKALRDRKLMSELLKEKK